MAKNKFQNDGQQDDLVSELSDAFGDVADALREVSVDISSIISKNSAEGAQRFRAAINTPPRPQTPYAPSSDTSVRAVRNGTKMLFSSAMRVFLSVCGGALLILAVLMFAFAADMGISYGDTSNLIFGMVMCVAFGAGARSCLSAARRSRRRDAYLRYIGTRDCASVAELAAAMRKKRKDVRTEITDLIRRGGFDPGYLTPDGDYFFVSSEAYRAYLEQADQDKPRTRTRKKTEEQAKPEPQPEPQEKQAAVQLEDEPLLRELAKEREKIDEAPVRAEVEKLEKSAEEIFDWVRRHPSDASQVRRFTGYYLPTTLKLLRTYNEMDLHAESSAVAEDIQNKIHSSLVNVNQAFGNLRDTLLRDTALDVDAEISALSTVLAQEGLVTDEISKHGV